MRHLAEQCQGKIPQSSAVAVQMMEIQLNMYQLFFQLGWSNKDDTYKFWSLWVYYTIFYIDVMMYN